jgi:cytidylate kinase
LIVIAMDGPAGAGKSTVGKAVARRLGLEYLDTGAMYRAVAFAALRRGIPVTDDPAVADLARDLALDVSEDGVMVDGVDATTEIRGREVTEAVSAVAANTPVREELRARQREWADARGGGVIEGRDIGTVVFPDADVKVYLDADPAERARRRANDPAHAGSHAPIEDVASQMAARDRSDTTRTTSPLQIAKDAVAIDTTNLEVDEVVRQVLSLVNAKR